MRCPVLWILVSYFYSDYALPKQYLELAVPDFGVDDDVPDNNFSIFFKKMLEKKKYDIEPLTHNGQDLVKIQETTTMYNPVTNIYKDFLFVSAFTDTKSNSDTSLLDEEDNSVTYTGRFYTKFTYKKNIESIISQDLILTTQKPYDNLNNILAVTEYQNNNVLSLKSTQEPNSTKALIWNRQPIVTSESVRCWPWPICGLWAVFNSPTNLRQGKGTIPAGLTYDFKRKLDVAALVDMVRYVAWDYENKLDLVNNFRDNLNVYSIPTCESLPTTEITSTETQPPLNFNEAPVVAKCFVCGLKEQGIPRSSACADAFSGDFIPLVKVDTKAKGLIASFRKYCRYLDIPSFMDIATEPRSTFGRFTGGCSVRWVDLTGVYTQRACRNQRRAVTGKHFASKRMAKLELTLSSLENGCIISPMATMLPVSRGISLYARFHACVCTGSWCNGAELTTKPSAAHILLMLVLLCR